MNTRADKSQGNKTRSVANHIGQKRNSNGSASQLLGYRPDGVSQNGHLGLLHNSSPGMKAVQLKKLADNYTDQQHQPIQKKSNDTGLPDQLKEGVEQQSGISLDDVKVHYNSSKPADLNAHAYAQGASIHVAPGQQKHLPHEAWHVVQQKQGRVKATGRLGNVSINDDRALEKEADEMGKVAVQKSTVQRFEKPEITNIDRKSQNVGNLVLQRLALINTDWDSVEAIEASSAGGSGVLFMKDSNDTLVVKPNIEPEDEKVAAYLHSAISGRVKEGIAKRPTGWQIKGLNIRIADEGDVDGIEHAKDRIFGNSLENDESRVSKLLSEVEANTTMIQESASGESETLEELMADNANDHIKPYEDREHAKRGKSKVKETSPLKLLTKDPSFVIALGRLTAADIVAGNGDRLIVKINFDNFLINLGDKTIFAIDNMELNDPKSISNEQVSLHQWANFPAQKEFIAKNFDGLASVVWDPKKIGNEIQGTDIVSYILEEDPFNAPRMVSEEQKDLVRDKLTKHIEKIQEYYAKGLAQGYSLILQKGEMPGDDDLSKKYNSRISVLRRGGH